MRMIKLPQGEWVRMADVALIQPRQITGTPDGEVVEKVIASELRIVIMTDAGKGIDEFIYQFPDGDKASTIADQLASQINSSNPYGLGGIVHT